MKNKLYYLEMDGPHTRGGRSVNGVVWFLRELDGVVNFDFCGRNSGREKWEVECDEFALIKIIFELNAKIIENH